MARTALVLGGGGVAGIAWQTGVLHGLAEAGVDVTSRQWSDMLLGTSAGSTVAAQVTGTATLGELYARQVDPQQQIDEPRSDVPIDDLTALLSRAAEHAGDDRLQFARLVGQSALAAATVPEAERRVVIGHRLPSHEWPDRDLRVVAVDAETGRHRVLDRTSGVRLTDAIAASCAIPGMWPPVTIGVHRYIDGAVRSSENLDLAVGFAKVLVLHVGLLDLAPADDRLARERELLVSRGSTVEVVRPDDGALAAIGPNATDPGVRSAAAEAGYRQGQRIADGIERFKQS